MTTSRTTYTLALALVAATTVNAQNALKDGTTLQWDKEIAVGMDSLRNDSVTVAALTVPVFEASAAQVTGLMKTVMPGAAFKKQGDLQKAVGVNFGPAGTPLDVLARVAQDKKSGTSTLALAFLQPGTSTSLDPASLQPAVRDLGVQLNKAVVQGQLNTWTAKLDKAGSKTESATQSQDKAQGRVNKAQADLDKIARDKSKLQSEHAILQKEIDLYNQKWTLSQDPKDFKKLTKSRAKITKNEGKMAKAMEAEAKSQKELTKSGTALPQAQKAKDQQAAAQAEVQRTVDALQRKLESIR
ncbi:MAG: hypothetical protein KBH07_00665 [Flavobacteriales bacterium]|nr:hypothetical protein [Flavobacteriales bacterium]MBP9078773.1 hypothetical protein [Flavobacteriales bacterium]